MHQQFNNLETWGPGHSYVYDPVFWRRRALRRRRAAVRQLLSEDLSS